MKKILFYTLMLCLTSFGFASCSDDDELTDSKITYYPTLEIQGDEFTIVPIGTPYVEKGCKGTLQGEDCTSGIVTSADGDEVDVNKPGLYYIDYSYKNKDGYTKKVTRTVAVCDPTITENFEGDYKVQAGSYRLSSGNTEDFKNYSVKVTRAAPGIFYISDRFGGYYDQGRGYGSTTALTGYLQLFSDNSIKLLSSYVENWGNSASDFTDGKYDPDTKTLSFVTTWEGMEFHIILKM